MPPFNSPTTRVVCKTAPQCYALKCQQLGVFDPIYIQHSVFFPFFYWCESKNVDIFFSTFSHVKLHLSRQVIGVWRLLSPPSVWVGFFSANKWAVNVSCNFRGKCWILHFFCRVIWSWVVGAAVLAETFPALVPFWSGGISVSSVYFKASTLRGLAQSICPGGIKDTSETDARSTSAGSSRCRGAAALPEGASNTLNYTLKHTSKSAHVKVHSHFEASINCFKVQMTFKQL